jgi:hypothetical protein
MALWLLERDRGLTQKSRLPGSQGDF